MPSRSVSNPLALAVLVCLWERPMYPYEITTTLKERGKEDSIRLNFGSLYAVIKSLEKHGFIEAARTERAGNRPERVVYEITGSGRAEARDWMRELIGRPAKEYPAFEAGLSMIGILPPGEVASLLRERIAALDSELGERSRMEEEAAGLGLPELFVIESEYRTAMTRAERAFVARLLDRVETGRLGGIQGWTHMHELIRAGVPVVEAQLQLHQPPERAAEPEAERR
ncbi:PadR family transcriptional regulator [Streptomyces hoynatensis]|uniref:PadR family transcriptional regulator n=1 Tax=Streptomyces hoynatensis TaxID=1141874 RepID=A0A3A9Z1B4_9ACTN|nr:PadR family transcriptional regulator [Streptomyces hoynatensis]RKN41819.1 PadR family transcriptional regulator [Streptomyces hoynatensis]